MSDVKPALTREEWERLEWRGEGERDGSGYQFVALDPEGRLSAGSWNPDYALGDVSGPLPDDGRKAIAALCLHDQPFGFTREDVVRHRECAKRDREIFHVAGLSDDPEDDYVEFEAAHRIDWHESMVDRIEALLPPEKT